MRRSAVTLALLGLVALGASPAVAQQPRPVVLAPAGAPTFPQRAFTLTVPERRLLAVDQLKVTENGEPVQGLTLTSTSGPRVRAFGAVLLIDASFSMQGGPIRKAMEAARAFAAQRSGNQQLGVVVFNRGSRVLIAPSSDQHAIDAALADAPRLGAKTRIYDAANTAMDLLAQAKIAAGTIVLLSDGADSGSLVPESAVAKRARRSNIRIFTVGLRSRSFDGTELKSLAAAGHGRYIPAESASALGRIFRDLGVQLASEYLVQYRSSTNAAGRDVVVAARVEGLDGVATSSYRVPGGTSFVFVEHSFWTSTLGVVLTTLGFALLLAIAFAILLRRRWRTPGVRERVRGFVSMPGDAIAREELVHTARAQRGAAERSLERTSWWPAFKEDVEIARIRTPAINIAAWTAGGFVVLFYLVTALTGLLLGLFVALAVPFSVRTFVQFKRDQQRNQFAEQLPDILQGSASAIRAGHALTGALTMVVEESAEPSQTEFRRVVTDEQLGVPLDEALRVVARRMDSRDVHQIALVAQIQRDTGGNTAEVLDRVTEALRQRAELRRMISALTAQGRLSRWVVTLLPCILLLIISILNPSYVEPLFTTNVGRLLLVIAALMMVAGSLCIKKIVDFKV